MTIYTVFPLLNLTVFFQSFSILSIHVYLTYTSRGKNINVNFVFLRESNPVRRCAYIYILREKNTKNAISEMIIVSDRFSIDSIATPIYTLVHLIFLNTTFSYRWYEAEVSRQVDDGKQCFSV